MISNQQVVRPSDGLLGGPTARFVDITPLAREQGFAWPVLLTEESAQDLCRQGFSARNAHVMQDVLLDALIHALHAKRARKDWTEITFEALVGSIDAEKPGELRVFKLSIDQRPAELPRLLLEIKPRTAELAS